MTNRILIGKIVSAHGIKGLVKVFPMCEDIDLLNGPLFTDENGPDTVEVKIKNALGKYYLAEVKGISDRNAAEILKCSLYIPREQLPETDNDEFYIEDLLGLNIVDEDGTPVGTVLNVDNFGASDLIEIQPSSGKSFYIPLTEDYVLDIGLDNNVITVADIDAFREE